MKERIIQFGEGNFLRGFVDYFIHCLNKKGLYDGKVVLVQPIATGMVEGLKAQDYKYNLFLRGIVDGEVVQEHNLIESIARGVDPYADFDSYMALAIDSMRLCSCTTSPSTIPLRKRLYL